MPYILAFKTLEVWLAILQIIGKFTLCLIRLFQNPCKTNSCYNCQTAVANKKRVKQNLKLTFRTILSVHKLKQVRFILPTLMSNTPEAEVGDALDLFQAVETSSRSVTSDPAAINSVWSYTGTFSIVMSSFQHVIVPFSDSISLVISYNSDFQLNIYLRFKLSNLLHIDLAFSFECSKSWVGRNWMPVVTRPIKKIFYKFF